MVTLEQVHLARGGEGTGLNFFIRDGSYTWKGYYIKKYHIFDPKTKKIIINDISKIKEKSNKEIEILELGSITQSTGFITDIPNCDLIRKRKPIFNSEDIFYIPSGESIGVNNYLGKNMRAFTRDKKLVCELYLPSTLFKKIVKVQKRIDRKPTYKVLRDQYQLVYKEHLFMVQANERQVAHDLNKEFLKDLEGINPFAKYYGNTVVTEKIKEKTLNNMKNFIKKYNDFKVER